MDSPKRIFAGLILLGILVIAVKAQVGKNVPVKNASVTPGVSYFDSKRVAAAISSTDSQILPGKVPNSVTGILLDWDGGEDKYYVRVTRQDTAKTVSEAHSFTHIWYITEGSATLVTGGTLINPKNVEPVTPWEGKELQGSGIERGETRHVTKGDVIVVPKGMPHWWKEVQGPFVYFVVNIR